jgi:hypothetical protein
MFGILKNVTKAIVGVATIPLDVAADVVTLGGACNDKKRPYTAEKISSIMENLGKAVDPDE